MIVRMHEEVHFLTETPQGYPSRKVGNSGSPSTGESAVIASSKTLTASEFLELVEQNRLVPPTILRQFHSNPKAQHEDAREFAEILVDGGHLTRWQMERILAGKGGFTLGKYKLMDRIAAGGMGVILKGWQPSQKRTVAIKVLSRTMLNKQEAVKRFEREIAAAGALDHPHIVRALDADCINGIPFLVMEYVEGKTLSSVINQRGPLPVDWACEFCRQAAMGLEHAHQRGLVHRDIKPSNLLLTRKSPSSPLIVKILDFGLARFTSESSESTELTAQNQVFGTIDYIAPEQARSAKTADIRADIFSLGCTLFYILTGTYPFTGDNVMEKLTARVTGEAPLISTVIPNIPQELEQVIAKMLQRDREQRYQNPSEVITALYSFSVTGKGEAEANSGVSRVLVHRRDTEPQPSPLPDPETQQSEMELDRFLSELDHNQKDQEFHYEPSLSTLTVPFPFGWRSLALIAVIVCVLALGAFLLTSDDSTEPSRPQQPTPAPTEQATPDTTDPSPLFAWNAGAKDAKELTLKGEASFGENGLLKLNGGSAWVHELDKQLVSAFQKSNEFSLHVIFRPEKTYQTGPARIISYSSGYYTRNFTLGQDGEKIILRLRTSVEGDTPELYLCKVIPNQMNHLLVTYRNGELLCYHQGKPALKSTFLKGDFSNWEPQQLLIGNESEGGRSWYGKIASVSLYAQVVSPQQLD